MNKAALAMAATALIAAPLWGQSSDAVANTERTSTEPTSTGHNAGAQTRSEVENWRAVEDCARLTLAESRHACIDRVLHSAGLLTPQRETAEQQETFGLSREQRVAQAIETGEMPETIAQSAPTPDPAAVGTTAHAGETDPVTSVASQIAFARMVGRNRLLIVTQSGAVWRQTSGDRIRRLPEIGSPFRASTAMMGGFRCRVDGSTTYRCERLD